MKIARAPKPRKRPPSVKRSILPFLFLAIPIIEITLFILVGQQIGVLATIGLVIATAITGATLMRVQGFGVVRRIQASLDGGGVPGRELVHGLMILIAGFLLLTPGFFTDTLGLLLFIPTLRDAAWRLIRSRITIVTSAAGGFHRPGRDRGRTIDLDEEDFARNRDNDRDPDDRWPRIER